MSNTIVRAPRRHRFVVIDQRAIEDTRLSWAARGLLGYLLSRPDDWKVLINDLRKRGDLGRDGVYRLLKELRVAGYVRFVRARDKQGRIRGGTYFVQEIAASPHPALPDTVEPDTAAPDPVNTEALPTTELDLRETTTTRPTTTQERRISRCATAHSTLAFADWVPAALRQAAMEKVVGLSLAEAQVIVDEWAGIMATGRIETSPLGYLHAMVSRFASGDFSLQYAEAVAEIRTQDQTSGPSPAHDA